MMDYSPQQCKKNALAALRGNWQTALLVCFFSGALATLFDLAVDEIPFRLETLSPSVLYSTFLAAAHNVPAMLSYLIFVLSILNLLFSPVLRLGANHYFVARLEGTELWFRGLFSRISLWGKALWLSLYITLKVFAWSLLFILPGIWAAIRYSLAYYFLAEDPSLSAKEAVEKSKEALKGIEWHYVRLEFSLLGWTFLPFLLSVLLYDIHPIIALVIYQFSNLAISTYIQGVIAAFFLAVRPSPSGGIT